jgi:hypothetical protein
MSVDDEVKYRFLGEKIMRKRENALGVDVRFEKTGKGFTLLWASKPKHLLELTEITLPTGSKNYLTKKGLLFASLHEAKMFFIGSLNHNFVH